MQPTNSEIASRETQQLAETGVSTRAKITALDRGRVIHLLMKSKVESLKVQDDDNVVVDEEEDERSGGGWPRFPGGHDAACFGPVGSQR